MASSSRSVRLSSSSLYDILGIDKSASVDDVRKAYKRKALATHPDKLNPDATEDERIHAETQFRKVNEAFNILSDSRQRQAYDVHFNAKDQRKRTPSEDLERRMKERAEWARRQEEQQRSRINAIKQRRQAEILRAQEIDRIKQMVNEMVDTLNNEIPGWVERKQKVEQVS